MEGGVEEAEVPEVEVDAAMKRNDLSVGLTTSTARTHDTKRNDFFLYKKIYHQYRDHEKMFLI